MSEEKIIEVVVPLRMTVAVEASDFETYAKVSSELPDYIRASINEEFLDEGLVLLSKHHDVVILDRSEVAYDEFGITHHIDDETFDDEELCQIARYQS
tara:strand:+ start:292 stop:585 length:294 start_codon:yes stop_codon:yes gene_type:complete